MWCLAKLGLLQKFGICLLQLSPLSSDVFHDLFIATHSIIHILALEVSIHIAFLLPVTMVPTKKVYA